MYRDYHFRNLILFFFSPIFYIGACQLKLPFCKTVSVFPLLKMLVTSNQEFRNEGDEYLPHLKHFGPVHSSYYYARCNNQLRNIIILILTAVVNLHMSTMVSLFEVFYVFFINFHTLNLKIIPRFIHHVQFLTKF
jgi:hypothetical protein